MLTYIDGSDISKDIVGGKASNLSKMKAMGLNVPSAFVGHSALTFKKRGATFNGRLNSYIRYLADESGKSWSLNHGDPLIVSVRSGSRISMPGMMDTILNIGLNRSNIDAFCESKNADKSFGLDCYRRLIQMYGETVKGIDSKEFSTIWNAAKTYYVDGIPEEGYERVISLYEKAYQRKTGESFPQDVDEQLRTAANAVYDSWFSEKAVAYRQLEGIPEDYGTAMTVQEMVFGNLPDSATGVAFSHDPNTGERTLYGDFLEGAQGEDVVAGIAKVSPISDMVSSPKYSTNAKQLRKAISAMVAAERDMVDVEFTVERGELYILQYRVAKRSTEAAVRCVLDMNREGVLDAHTASKRIFDLMPKKDRSTMDASDLNFVGAGVGATSDEVVGCIATTHEQANACHEDGVDYIYVAMETSPEDSVPMANSVGILTGLGGKLSHAAVVARGWNKSCVVGFSKLKEVNDDEIIVGTSHYEVGSLVKIDGKSGEVYL